MHVKPKYGVISDCFDKLLGVERSRYLEIETLCNIPGFKLHIQFVLLELVLLG